MSSLHKSAINVCCESEERTTKNKYIHNNFGSANVVVQRQKKTKSNCILVPKSQFNPIQNFAICEFRYSVFFALFQTSNVGGNLKDEAKNSDIFNVLSDEAKASKGNSMKFQQRQNPNSKFGPNDL